MFARRASPPFALRCRSAVAPAAPAQPDTRMQLTGSIKPYKRHVVLFDPRSHTEWPAQVEALNKLQSGNGLADSSTRIIASIVDASQSPVLRGLGEAGSVLVFPEQVIVRNAIPSVDAPPDSQFLSALIQSTPIEIGTEALRPLGVEAFPGLVYLVCAHSKRDFRCEVCGPALASTLQGALQGMPVPWSVLKCSHIGGHRLAANVVCYPSGDWFGHMNAKADVEALVHHHRALVESAGAPACSTTTTPAGPRIPAAGGSGAVDEVLFSRAQLPPSLQPLWRGSRLNSLVAMNQRPAAAQQPVS